MNKKLFTQNMATLARALPISAALAAAAVAPVFFLSQEHERQVQQQEAPEEKSLEECVMKDHIIQNAHDGEIHTFEINGEEKTVRVDFQPANYQFGPIKVRYTPGDGYFVKAQTMSADEGSLIHLNDGIDLYVGDIQTNGTPSADLYLVDRDVPRHEVSYRVHERDEYTLHESMEITGGGISRFYRGQSVPGSQYETGIYASDCEFKTMGTTNCAWNVLTTQEAENEEFFESVQRVPLHLNSDEKITDTVIVDYQKKLELISEYSNMIDSVSYVFEHTGTCKVVK